MKFKRLEKKGLAMLAKIEKMRTKLNENTEAAAANEANVSTNNGTIRNEDPGQERSGNLNQFAGVATNEHQ